MKKIKLTPRLAAVASFVGKCETVADIGTDHGFVPTYLIQNGLCKRAIASDINKEPLQSAIRTAHTYGVFDKTEFVCASGLDGVCKGSADTVVIAGMGGETIADILRNAPWLCECRTQLVLQPQSKLEVLECFLNENGYSVNAVKLVKDSGKIYIVLTAQFTGEMINRDVTYFAEHLINDPLLEEYVAGIRKKLVLRKRGLMSATHIDEAELELVIRREKYLTSFIREE